MLVALKFNFVQSLNSFREEGSRNIYDCRTFLARFVEKHLSDFDEGMFSFLSLFPFDLLWLYTLFTIILAMLNK